MTSTSDTRHDAVTKDSNPMELERGIKAALDFFNAGKLVQAEAAGLHLLQREPSNPSVHQLLAVILLQRGQATDAFRHILQSLSQRPDHQASLIVAGRIARTVGDLGGACVYFKRGTELAPEAAEPFFLWGSVLLEMDDPAASSVFAQLLRRHPRHAAAWCYLGLALKKAGKPEEALHAYGTAIECDSGLGMAHFHQANLLRERGRLPEAIAAFQSAQSCDIGAKEIAFNLGLVLHQSGFLQSASEAFERTISLAPSFAEAWFNSGLVLQDLRRLSEAAAAFRNALEKRPDYAEAAVNLGIVLQDAGQLDDAIVAYRSAMKLRPETFGRIAQAMTAASTGRMWLDLEALRTYLSA